MAAGVESEVFESRLAAGFESLLANKGGSYMSLPWIQQALGFLNQMQREMELLAPDLHGIQCGDPAAKAKWMRESVADMEKLLQACAILVRSVSDLTYYHMFVQLVIQSVQSGHYGRARQLLTSRESVMEKRFGGFPDNETSRLSLQRARLEKSHTLLLQVLGTDIPPYPAECERDPNEILLPILYGMRTAATFVLLVLGVCLTVRPAVPSDSDVVRKAMANREDLRQASPRWVEPMMKLCDSLRKEVLIRTEDCSQTDRPFAFLHELGEMDGLVRELGTLLLDQSIPNPASVQECLAELRRSVDRIESALPAVESHIHGISKAVGSSRAIVLQLLCR